MTAADGKQRMTDVADTEQLLRLIQSVPSPKAEPFKRWLAKVGHERLEEIENPELAAKRMRAIYEQKGYSEEWIEKRLRGIAVRDELTDEWNKRGVKEGRDFAILTAEISKATFGMTPAQYKEFKALSNPKENLRDHMTDLELIFTMLGEASTTEIAKNRDVHGFPQNQQAAKAGGTIAGDARNALEQKSGNKISTSENYQALTESKKRNTFYRRFWNLTPRRPPFLRCCSCAAPRPRAKSNSSVSAYMNSPPLMQPRNHCNGSSSTRTDRSW